MSELVNEVTDQSFEQDVLKSDQPVMVDFWAEWCYPCKALAPTVEKLAQEYQGKMKVVKLNVDLSNGTATHYNVRGIPALIVFKDGTEFDRIIGNAPKDKISQMIDRALNPAS